MSNPIEKKKDVISALLHQEIDVAGAAQMLSCSKKTIQRYKRKFVEKGIIGLRDNRHSNNYKLTADQKKKIREIKDQDRWRSARNIRDKLHLPVHKRTIERLIKDAGLGKQNIKKVKPLHTFEAPYANALWQTDIMGRIDFPAAGTLYLIATLDDHSRFVPAGRFFRNQNKINVFSIWYESLSKCGIPDAMLQDEGSQYKARVRFGEADYEGYARMLGIKLIWAVRAQTKGKIERFWRFVQDDFVREVWNVGTIEEINGAFKVWLAKYNYVFKSDYFGHTRISRYKPSEKRVSQLELQHILTILERRRVSMQNTVSLYGSIYPIPPGYTKCRIWVKIIGNKVLFESMGHIFWKTRLKMQ